MTHRKRHTNSSLDKHMGLDKHACRNGAKQHIIIFSVHYVHLVKMLL